MRVRSTGMGVRYETPFELIEAERRRAPGIGQFMNYKKWCYRCCENKPTKGVKKIAPGIFMCSDCRG